MSPFLGHIGQIPRAPILSNKYIFPLIKPNVLFRNLDKMMFHLKEVKPRFKKYGSSREDIKKGMEVGKTFGIYY